MTERVGFYERVLGRLVDEGLVGRDWSVLVVAGGAVDRAAFAACGFTDVTFTNLSGDGDERQDAEALTYDDESFDFAVISAGLHHCASPHRALLELYRVSRHGVLALEARDSALMRFAQRLGVVDEYELTAVADNDYAAGGVRNSAVPTTSTAGPSGRWRRPSRPPPRRGGIGSCGSASSSCPCRCWSSAGRASGASRRPRCSS